MNTKLKSIMKKTDVEKWMTEFSTYAEKDNAGNKHYFVIEDAEKDGILTIMKYPDNSWTIHGRGDKPGKEYCDENEKQVAHADIASLAWKNRKAINQRLKELMTV